MIKQFFERFIRKQELPEVKRELPPIMLPPDKSFTIPQPKKLDHANWSDIIKDDCIRLFVGEELGFGAARKVYSMVGHPDLVLKIEFTQETFQNVLEWQLWNELQFTEYGKWLAPCRRISPCGCVLIQERTEPLPDIYALTHVPDWLGDLKEENFGLIGSRLVCHDYALHGVIHQFKHAAANTAR